MLSEYDINNFDIEIIDKEIITSEITSPFIRTKVKINGYEIFICVNLVPEIKNRFPNEVLYQDYLDMIIKQETVAFYVNDKLLIRKEKLKKIKKRIYEKHN